MKGKIKDFLLISVNTLCNVGNGNIHFSGKLV